MTLTGVSLMTAGASLMITGACSTPAADLHSPAPVRLAPSSASLVTAPDDGTPASVRPSGQGVDPEDAPASSAPGSDDVVRAGDGRATASYFICGVC
jgi:hypothetical protein